MTRRATRWVACVEPIKPPPAKPVATSGSHDERPRIERSTALRTRTPVITPLEDILRGTLKNEELDEAIKIMFSRLAGPDRDRVIDVPDSLAFFYRWKQAGGEEDLKKWMGEQSSTDSGFLKLLHKCRSWVASSSEGVSYPLNKRDVEAFMDFDAVIERLANISQDINAPEKDRELAIVLRAAVKTDD